MLKKPQLAYQLALFKISSFFSTKQCNSKQIEVKSPPHFLHLFNIHLLLFLPFFFLRLLFFLFSSDFLPIPTYSFDYVQITKLLKGLICHFNQPPPPQILLMLYFIFLFYPNKPLNYELVLTTPNQHEMSSFVIYQTTNTITTIYITALFVTFYTLQFRHSTLPYIKLYKNTFTLTDLLFSLLTLYPFVGIFLSLKKSLTHTTTT